MHQQKQHHALRANVAELHLHVLCFNVNDISLGLRVFVCGGGAHRTVHTSPGAHRTVRHLLRDPVLNYLPPPLCHLPESVKKFQKHSNEESLTAQELGYTCLHERCQPLQCPLGKGLAVSLVTHCLETT